MSEPWREHSGVEITTDPQRDAAQATEKTDEAAPQGVKFVGGAQHGKADRGVKRVSRRGSN